MAKEGTTVTYTAADDTCVDMIGLGELSLKQRQALKDNH